MRSAHGLFNEDITILHFQTVLFTGARNVLPGLDTNYCSVIELSVESFILQNVQIDCQLSCII